MAEDRPRSVKEVSAEDFITAFSAYLKQTNKVRPLHVQAGRCG
jgi:ribosomal protein S19E (S16A)